MRDAPRLVLASASPRRRELLALLGLKFEVAPSDVDEAERPGELPHDYALRLAMEKANAVAAGQVGINGGAELFVLGADTVVVSDVSGEPTILGKPADAAGARRMLEALSNCTHTVMTAVALVRRTGCGDTATIAAAVEQTRVRFRLLSPGEIHSYVASGEPFDKAGGYGVQGGASAFVQALCGDYYNVVGLPLTLVRSLLEPHFVGLHPAPPPPRGLPFLVAASTG